MALSMQKKSNRILLHVLFWVAYIIYRGFNSGLGDMDAISFHLPINFLGEIPVAIFVSYVNLYLLMPAFYKGKKYFIYASVLLGLLLIGGLIDRYLAYAIFIPLEKVSNPLTYIAENKVFWIPIRILNNAAGIFPVVAATMLIKLMVSSYHYEKKLREIQKEKFVAEMALLRAQINPHFFFNTLNSLYSLILAGSEKAKDVVLQLSGLMHYMLYEAGAEKVLLRNEINYLEDYISVEQMRFAERLDLSFQYSGDIEGKLIAPLLLLPFIENAFKYSVEDNEGWVTINLKVIDNRLFLKVENSSNSIEKPADKGLGLSTVKRRLELIYPGLHTLVINRTKDIFEVDLKLCL